MQWISLGWRLQKWRRRKPTGGITELSDDEEIRTSGAPYSGDLAGPHRRYAAGEGRAGHPG
jgi:hypothetical protein